MMQEMNKDVPVEAVVKWLARERDNALDKLEKLTGYTKALEIRVMEMEAARNIEREENCKAIVKARKEAFAQGVEEGKRKAVKPEKKLTASIHRLHEELKHITAWEGVEL